MALPAHLTLEGKKQGKIEGSCDMQGREGTILVYGMNHEKFVRCNPVDALSTDKQVLGLLSIVKEFDKSSPKFYQALYTGEHLEKVIFKWYRISKQGTEEHYFTHILEDATVISVSPFMPSPLLSENDPNRQMETVSFTYKKIKWTWESNNIYSEDPWIEP